MNPEKSSYEELNIADTFESETEFDPSQRDIQTRLHDLSREGVKFVLENNELVAVGLLGLASGAYYMALNDIGNTDLADFIGQKLIGTAGTVFVSGQFYDRLILHRSRERGLQEVPRSWSGHNIIFDLNRQLFNSMSRVRSKNKNVLIHDGNLIENDHFVGRPLDLRREWQLNAQDIEYMADDQTLKNAQIQHSGGVFINLWNTDDALYNTTYNETAFPLHPENVRSILMSIEQSKRKKVGIIAPEGMKRNGVLIDNIFTHENFKALGSIEIFHPEDIVENKLAQIIHDIERKRQDRQPVKLAIDTDTEQIRDRFCTKMESRGISIVDPEEAHLVVVDRTEDVDVLWRCGELKKEKKQAIAFLERYSNVPKARRDGAYAWSLADMVAQALPIETMGKYY